MQLINKKYIPFLFLFIISIWWTFYYQSSTSLNDFGESNFEWLYLIDGLIVLPIICFVCLKDRKEAATKAVAYACLVVFIASFIVPEKNKFILTYLESGRYLVLIGFLFIELMAMATLIFAVKTSLKRKVDPDKAINESVEKIVGKGMISQILSFETRMWTYALFSNRINRKHFEGIKHFFCDKKDGAKSNLLGFIFIIAIELPIVHLLLHFTWSPFAANVTSALTLFGLIFFIAEYRAISIRPVSLTPKQVIIRYGIFAPLEINLASIESIKINQVFIPRNSKIRRFNLSGIPNVEIKLKGSDSSSGSSSGLDYIYLGVDEPAAFIRSCEEFISCPNETLLK